jgi:hypothetical protein
MVTNRENCAFAAPLWCATFSHGRHFMNNPGLFQARWNLRQLALCNFVPLALLAFWLWPTGQMLCVIFDEWLFHLLNAPLASNPIWLRIWAIASLRPFDVGSFADECGA